MEEILKYIGNYGKYQIYICILLLFPMLMSGNLTLISSFTMGVPNTRCYVPGYDNDSTNYDTPFENNLTKFLFLSSKTQNSGTTYCSYCDLSLTLSENKSCTSDIAQPCQSYIYDKSQYQSSVTELFNMVCSDVWKYEVLQSLFSIGIFVGSAFFGYIGDRFGRRIAFLSAGLSQIIVLNLVPISVNFYAYGFMQILAGGLQNAVYLTGFIILMEMFGGLPQTIVGILAPGCFSLGYFYVGLMAYLIRDWQWLYWSVALLSLLYIPFYWLLPESIRWLVVNNRPEDAEKIVLKAAKWNGVTIPEQVLKGELYLIKDIPQVTVLELFKYKELTIVTLIVCFTWLVDSLCYYGLSWNITWLPGNNYANFVLSGMTDIVSYICCIPIMEYFGRRYTLSAFFVIGGVSLIISGFVPGSKLIVLFTLIGRFTIAGGFSITYVYTAEVFPTVVRNSASGVCSMASRIGNIAAPLIALLSDYSFTWVPVVIYGSFGLVAGLADWFLPETKGKPLCETVEEEIESIRNIKNKNKKEDAYKAKDEKY